MLGDSHCSQNPLCVLESKKVTIQLQQAVVPWLIAMFGIDYPTEATADVVRQMLAAIVKRDNIKGLGASFDNLVAEYPTTADEIAEKTKYGAGDFVLFQSSCTCFLQAVFLTFFCFGSACGTKPPCAGCSCPQQAVGQATQAGCEGIVRQDRL